MTDKPDVPADGQRVVEAWNAMAGRTGLPKIRLMNLGRAAKLRKRLEEVGVDALLEAVDAVEASPFCRGENDREWKADFDFVLQPRSLTRLLEHGYKFRRNRHAESVNGAAILLDQLNDQTPLLEGNAHESD